jgi:pyruvate dehydrogenase E1 component alpha subunit
VLAVRDAIQRAAALAREQHEPSLVEAVSFRFRGHSVVDPDRYRNPEEVKEGRAAHEPIAAFAARLKAAGISDDAGLQQIEEQVEQEVEQAVQFAEQSPDPALETLLDHIYASADVSSGGN